MRTTLVAALLVVMPAAAPASESTTIDPSSKGGVRPVTRSAADLLEDGRGRSALLRSQLAVLEASDVVVYLTEVFESAAGEPKGKLQFLAANAGRRYVVVTLDRWKLSTNDRLVILSHELQHAMEVARTPAVTDAASFEALYRRIGWQLTAGHFETQAACQAAARMRVDLHLSRPAPVAGAEARAVESHDDSGRNPHRNRRTP